MQAAVPPLLGQLQIVEQALEMLLYSDLNGLDPTALVAFACHKRLSTTLNIIYQTV